MKSIRTLSIAAALALVALTSCKSSGVGAAQASGEPGPRGGGFAGSAFTAAENMEHKSSLRPQAITVATVNGAAVDREDFNSALVVCDVGPLGGTTPTLDVKVQESTASGGTYTDVTGAVFTQFTASRDDGVFVGSLTLSRRQQFLRLVGVGAGTSPTGSFACGFTLVGAVNAPVTQTNAADFNVR